jgi:uncharacterized protein (TIGR02271 family)
MNDGRVRRGMIVFGPDGERLGRVLFAGDEAFVLERGLLAPECYLARYDELRDAREGALTLAAPAEALPRWEPGGEALYPREDSYYRGEPREDVERAPYQTEAPPRGAEAPAPYAHPEAWRGDTREEEIRLPLLSEELVPERHIREAGRVRIHKTVKTEHRAIIVPVRREEVRVERVPAGAPLPEALDGAAEIFTVPVFEEEIEIRRRPVLREEIRVIKAIRREERELSAEVRREELEVDGPTTYDGEGAPRS